MGQNLAEALAIGIHWTAKLPGDRWVCVSPNIDKHVFTKATLLPKGGSNGGPPPARLSVTYAS